VPTGDSGTPERKDLRDQTWFRLALVAFLALLIFAVSRGCQREGLDVTQDEAVEIAKREVDFEPDDVQVRLLRQGVAFTQHWIVGLAQKRPNGARYNSTVVVIDAESGEVLEVRT
jgi:preprotein translocase subunit SecF